MIDLKVLYLVLSYNWLVNNKTCFFKLKIGSFMGLKLISFIINSSSASLLNNIINKNTLYNSNSVRRISLEEISLCY